jgi:hypothetical protein
MGSKFAASFPILGSQPVSIHQFSGRLLRCFCTPCPSSLIGFGSVNLLLALQAQVRIELVANPQE